MGASQFDTNSDSDVYSEKPTHDHLSPERNQKERQQSTITFPPPWKYEKYFIGGYKQSRMIKFKNPKNMYTAINLFAGIAIMFYGYDQGVMSQVNLNEDYWNRMGINPVTGNKRNTAALGGIVAVYYGGTLIGALIAGTLADRCGRIKAVVFGSVWAFLGAVLQASAYNITWMCCARVIAGIGVGALDCVVPVWSAEVSSHSARGAFLAIEFFMVSFDLKDTRGTDI